MSDPAWAPLHHNTPAVPAVWADWARAAPVLHLDTVDAGALGTLKQGRVEFLAKLDIDEVILSAGGAVGGGVLRAHQGRLPAGGRYSRDEGVGDVGWG